MREPRLDRYVSNGVTLLGDKSRPGGVTFAFTERTGGVSKPPYESLNLGSRCGDDPEAVETNRSRALVALGAGEVASNLVTPCQVHGDEIVVVRSNVRQELERAREAATAGADGIVCLVPDVPVLLCFADCVPVVLVTDGAFAVIHSGWRGTEKRIAAKAARVLCDESGCDPQDVLAYVGPHILGDDYEVSEELLLRFEREFGTIVRVPGKPRNLALGPAIVSALETVGVRQCHVLDSMLSTARNVNRFYSFRAEDGKCGRHAAIAWMPSSSSR